MRFVMFVRVEEGIEVPPDQADPQAWVDETEAAGVRLDGDRLRGIEDATTVRDGGRLITDGPFAEAKEQIAGFDVLECRDLRHAVEVAARHPVARFGALELRQVRDE